MNQQSQRVNLNQASMGDAFEIVAVTVPHDAPDWGPWLSEIGFIVGESVVVKRRSILQSGAVVVQVGLSTFALHPDEAACVWVEAMPNTEGVH